MQESSGNKRKLDRTSFLGLVGIETDAKTVKDAKDEIAMNLQREDPPIFEELGKSKRMSRAVTNDTAEDVLESFDDRFARLEQMIRTTEEARKEDARLQHDKNSSLEGKNSSLEGKNSSLEDELKNMKKECRRHTAELKKMQEELSDLRAELRQTQKTLGDSDTVRLRQLCKVLEMDQKNGVNAKWVAADNEVAHVSDPIKDREVIKRLLEKGDATYQQMKTAWEALYGVDIEKWDAQSYSLHNDLIEWRGKVKIASLPRSKFRERLRTEEEYATAQQNLATVAQKIQHCVHLIERKSPRNEITACKAAIRDRMEALKL